MKTIKVIDALYLTNDGLRIKTKNGRFQIVHLRQGDLDGACAIYSTMMILLMIGSIKHSDIKLFGNQYDKRLSIEKLKKEFLESRGLHREGNSFSGEDGNDIKSGIERSFSKYVNVELSDTKNQDSIDKINSVILCNQPVLMSIQFKGGAAHAMVAIGVECDELDQPVKIFCLDPGYASPKYTYWNTTIDLKKNKGSYCYRYITETDGEYPIQLADILIITKK